MFRSAARITVNCEYRAIYEREEAEVSQQMISFQQEKNNEAETSQQLIAFQQEKNNVNPPYAK